MKKEPTSFLKGMIKESTDISQPKGSWTFALNTMFGSWNGDVRSVTNEIGNELCFNVGENGLTLVGAQALIDSKFLLFFTDNSISYIGIHDALNCTWTLLVKTTCLDLKRHRMLNTKFHIIAGCERVVNFTDGVTSYKSINIDSLTQYLAEDANGEDLFTLATANVGTNYTTAWNCIKMNHFPAFSPGCINVDVITDSGGTIKAGSHQFALRYLDADLNPTNFSPVHYPIYIYTEGTSSSTADGEVTGVVTNKIINFNLTLLDPTFEFVQLAVMSSVQGTKTVDEVFILDKIPVAVAAGIGTADYTWTGFNSSTHTISSLDQVTVPNITLTGVKAHEIIDNRLVLANTASSSEDYATMQRAWLNAKVKWRMYDDYEIDPNNIDAPQSEQYASKNAKRIFINKTFMRDEIYALGGGFLMNDGTKTPAFHKPGRPANLEYTTNADLTGIANANSRNLHNSRGNTPLANQWDTRPLTVKQDGNMELGDEDDNVAWSNVEHIINDLQGCTINRLTATPITLTYDMAWAGNNGTFTLNLPNATDRALVKLTTNGVRFRRGQDAVFGSLTQASPTLNISGHPNSTNSLITIHIWYFNGVNQNSYHEITGGSRTSSTVGTFDITLNECITEFPSGCTIPRWRVHNTWVATGLNNVNDIEGYMGYHESTSARYPTTTDCNGVAVYGTLAGQPIRHHRMPDCGGDAENFGISDNKMGLTVRDFVDADNIVDGPALNWKARVKANKLGLIVDVTDVYNALPTDIQDKIVGHYIYYGKRETINKTIIDKGYAWRNQNRSQFWSEALRAQDGLGGTWWDTWWNSQSRDGPFGTSGPLTYDDQTIIWPVIGRTRIEHFNSQEGFRADYAFSSSIPTQIGYGYYNNFSSNIGLTNDGPHGTDENVIEFYSPKTIFNRSVSSGGYMKIECPISSYKIGANATNEDQEFRASHTDEFEYANEPILNTDQTWLRGTAVTEFNHIANHVPLNGRNATANDTVKPTSLAFLGFHRKLTGSAIVPYNSSGAANNFTTPLTLHTDAGGQITSFYQSARPFPLALVPSLTQTGDIMRGHSSSAIGGDTDTTNGLWATQTQSVYYVSVKDQKEVFTSLQDITYLHVNTCYIPKATNSLTEVVKGGDTFITKMRAVKTHSRKSGNGDRFESVKAIANAMEGFVESDDVNSALAHSNGTDSNYAPRNFNFFEYLNIGEDTSFNYGTLWDGVDLTTNDAMNVAGFTYREFKWTYNPDYGKQLVESPVFPLSDTYNYCDNCSNREPNAIYYSNRGFSSDNLNNFKIVPANNKFLIPSESGRITNLFLEKDQLYAHTTKALFAVQTRPQQLNTDTATIFVDTGTIGSIPPKRLISVQHGYAGSVDPTATVGTQYGTFFVDSQSGRVFLFGKGINELSQKGMQQWFKDNLPLNFASEYYRATNGSEYTVRGTSSQNSVGFQASYDDRMNRMLLHKADYGFRAADDANVAITFIGTVTALPATANVNDLYALANSDDITWHRWDGAAFETITLQDKRYFENLSWNISYALDANFWTSFHSWQPNYMYHDNKNIYSFINRDGIDTAVWKHVERNYQNYYGTKYDHIIEVSHSAGGVEKGFYSVQLKSDCWLYVANSKRFVKDENVSYDNFYVYNSKQCSSKRNLIVKTANAYQDVTLPMTQTLMDRTENYWRFNRFRDEVIDYTIPHLTEQWTNLQGNYSILGQGYIDKVIDPLAVANTKNIYEQGRLRDKSLSVRLFFNPTGDYKIVTQMEAFLTNVSRR